MPVITPSLLALSTAQAIGTVIALVIVVGFVVYGLVNIRAGREEVGAELELAANLKPYLDDDELETTKLDRSLQLGLGALVLIGIGLPAYWLAEPGRQEGAVDTFDEIAVSRGEGEYAEFCSSCHGPEGVGGVAPYTIFDDDGEFVAQTNWKAPALDTVLQRYSEEEVTFILNYGRPFSPMPAWGTPGGGALTEQQVQNLIDYLSSIQLSSTESKAQVENELRTVLDIGIGEEIDYEDPAVGEALFNLGEETDFAAGAYACARCHTRGWSIATSDAVVEPDGADLGPFVDTPEGRYEDGSGAYGPSLRSNIIPRLFDDVEALSEFLYVGAEQGQSYGNNGLSGQGMMPGFGENPNTEETADDGMLTDEMIQAIARYVESLGEDG